MAKYKQSEIDDMGKKGQAFGPDPDGHYSYPVGDSDDLDNAIHAVGRGNADHDAIRKYIIGRAKALGLSSKIPETWNADGSMSDANAAEVEAEERADDCPTCKGKGTIMAGNRKCPDCQGSGNAPESKSDDTTGETPEAPARKPRHRSTIPASLEVRRFAAADLEVRSGTGSNTVEVTGTPIVYNTPYTVTDMFGEFTETMARGVAKDVLSKNADVRFLFNHDGLPLARSTSGTLEMRDGANGLSITATLDSRQSLANDLAVAIERGDVSQMSCGFIVANDTWNDDMTTRTINRFADLLDVSAVTYPASPTTSISIAERMMMEAPVESRARVRRMWSVSKELRNGRQLTPESAALMMDGLEVLATADENVEDALVPEERAAPTAQDANVAKAIVAAHSGTAAALHAQVKDPDNNSDPQDKKVLGHLTDAHTALTKALEAQGKDGAPDDNSVPPVGGPDGTQGSNGDVGSGSQDGTGSRADEAPAKSTRSAALKLELDLLALRRR